jgi:hypothetical protein
VYDSERERGPKTEKKRQGTGKRPCMTVAGRLPCRLGALTGHSARGALLTPPIQGTVCSLAL